MNGRSDLLRVVAVTGLLTAAALAYTVRQGRPIPGVPDGRSDGVLFAMLTGVTACWILTYVLVKRVIGEIGPGDAARTFAARHARAAAALLATAAFGVSAALLLLSRGGGAAPCHADDSCGERLATSVPTPTTLTPTPSPSRSLRPAGDEPGLPTGLLPAVAVLLILLAVSPLAWTAYRRISPPPAGEPPAGLTPAMLRTAVEAAGYALRRGDGPRDAVIDCYAAMEGALASAGAPLRRSDTPAQVLGRAAREGLIAGRDAEVLTDLFRTARFSRHPVTEDDVRRAQDALTGVRDHLMETT